METQPSGVLFHEEQQLRQKWLWIAIYGIAALNWYGWMQQIILGKPFGTNPAPDWAMWLLLLLFGIGLPVLFHSVKLIVEVHSVEIAIRYHPFVTREIPLVEIAECQALTYQPIKEFGGWGVRGWKQRRAYNISGDQGVELALLDGQTVLVGSQRAQELAQTILSAHKTLEGETA